MARTHQRARCSHTGPPCLRCVREMLLCAQERKGRSARDPEVQGLVAVLTQAAVFVNEGRDYRFDRVSTRALPGLAAQVEGVYRAVLRRGGAEEEAARQALLRARVLGPRARRACEALTAVEHQPQNQRRARRLALFSERRASAAGGLRAVVPGGPAAGAGGAALVARLRELGGPAAQIAGDLEAAVLSRLASRPGEVFEVLASTREAAGGRSAQAVIRNSRRQAVYSVSLSLPSKGGSSKSVNAIH